MNPLDRRRRCQIEMEPGIYDADGDLATLRRVVATMLESDTG